MRTNIKPKEPCVFVTRDEVKDRTGIYSKEEIEKLIKRLDKEINKTPTSELRNLLADVNICLRFLNKEK